MSIEAMVYTLSSALNGLFLPKVTRLSHKGDAAALTDLMIRVGRIQLYIISLIFFGFLIFGQSFLHLWAGDKFTDTYYVVLFLIGTNIVSLTQNVASDLVYAENKVRYTAILTFFASGLALLGTIALAPRFGAIGCAISFFVAMSINLVQLNLFYRKKLSIQVSRFFKECHMRVLPIIVLLSLLFWFLFRQIEVSNWIQLILYGFFYVVLYFVTTYFLVFNSEEKSLIVHLLHK